MTNLIQPDIVDIASGIQGNNVLMHLRQQRVKVRDATQGSYQALFDSNLEGISLHERLSVALLASALTPCTALVAHYRNEFARLSPSTSQDCIDALSKGTWVSQSTRESALLSFTQLLIENPIAGDMAALLTLPAAGVSTPAVVAVAQLISFLSYQVRLVAGLQAMAVLPMPEPSVGSTVPKPSHIGVPAGIAQAQVANTLNIHGFTNASLNWTAWLDTLTLEQATPLQIKVLEESHPKAKSSDYYLSLIHQPRILQERSTVFNAIMYAPAGLSRAERELGATVVSRINGCVYCGSVHAQRFEQMAKRQDVIAQVFTDPRGAGTTEREKAICAFSVAITERPGRLVATDISGLYEVGLSALEVLDLIHADAIFAWANRLMLNLGEPS